MEDIIKQVIVVRTDLNMRRGKEASQVAHASLKVFLDRTIIDPLPNEHPYHSDTLYYTAEMKGWINDIFTKIVLGCNSEKELLNLQKKAGEANIVNAIILDSGKTEFFKYQCPICKADKFSLEINTVDDTAKCGQCLTTYGTEDIEKVSVPTYTTLAIGPDYSSKIDKITKDLKLR